MSGPTDVPHTRRPRARPTPAGRKGSDRLGRKSLALHVRERREKMKAVRPPSPAHADFFSAVFRSPCTLVLAAGLATHGAFRGSGASQTNQRGGTEDGARHHRARHHRARSQHRRWRLRGWPVWLRSDAALPSALLSALLASDFGRRNQGRLNKPTWRGLHPDLPASERVWLVPGEPSMRRGVRRGC